MGKKTTALLAALAFLLAACSTTETDDVAADSSADAEGAAAAELAFVSLRSGLLQRTLDPTDAATTAQFEGRMTFAGSAGKSADETTVAVTGTYDLAADAATTSMGMVGFVSALIGGGASGGGGLPAGLSGSMLGGEVQVINIGDRSWMKAGMISMFLGAGSKWIEDDGTGAATTGLDLDLGFGATGSPLSLLSAMADASGAVESLGASEVRGTPTQHYRLLFDSDALAASMTAEQMGQLTAQLGAAPVVPLELWIGDDGLLYRYEIDLSDPEIVETLGVDAEGLTVSFDFWDHGAAVNIAAPPADQVVRSDELNIGIDQFAEFLDIGDSLG
ncbi:MAG: hypothetical protein ACRBK7_23535 [Acidimicrobiales bacterium]